MANFRVTSGQGEKFHVEAQYFKVESGVVVFYDAKAISVAAFPVSAIVRVETEEQAARGNKSATPPTV